MKKRLQVKVIQCFNDAELQIEIYRNLSERMYQFSNTISASRLTKLIFPRQKELVKQYFSYLYSSSQVLVINAILILLDVGAAGAIKGNLSLFALDNSICSNVLPTVLQSNVLPRDPVRIISPGDITRIKQSNRGGVHILCIMIYEVYPSSARCFLSLASGAVFSRIDIFTADVGRLSIPIFLANIRWKIDCSGTLEQNNRKNRTKQNILE